MLAGFSENVIGKVKLQYTVVGGFVTDVTTSVTMKGNSSPSNLVAFDVGLATVQVRLSHPIPFSQRRSSLCIGDCSGNATLRGVFTGLIGIVNTVDDELSVFFQSYNLEPGQFPDGVHFIEANFAISIV